MPIYLLGIIRTGEISRLPAELVRWVAAQDLAVAVAGPQSAAPTPEEHARVLSAIHRHVDVLPMQFGAAAPDEAAVKMLLHARREELALSLDRVKGASEMGLRISLPHGSGPHFSTPAVPVSSDRYLASRRDHYATRDGLSRRAESAVAGYVEALGGLCRDWRQLVPAPAGVVRLAFLVDRRRLAAFGERLAMYRRARETERCAALGPWPPYSFVQES